MGNAEQRERMVTDALQKLARAVTRGIGGTGLDPYVREAADAGAEPSEINDAIADAEGERDS